MKAPEERGKYLYPEAFGLSRAHAIGYRDFRVDYDPVQRIGSASSATLKSPTE